MSVQPDLAQAYFIRREQVFDRQGHRLTVNSHLLSEAQQEALVLARAKPQTPSSLERVAKVSGPELARWAFEQWALRERGKNKFAKAEEMLFTRAGLEMATHERVAAWRAGQFPAGELVVDLTCGIGADLIGFASRGPATGFDLDEETCGYARHNLDVYEESAEVIAGDGLGFTGAKFAFADPARRVANTRTLNPDHFSPDPRVVSERFAGLELGAMKLSPMLDDAFLESLGSGLDFVSHHGECCEALVWSGQQATHERRAVHVESGATLTAREIVSVSETPLSWIAEADPAAIRAHVLGHFENAGLQLLGDSRGYLTGLNQPEATPWLTQYEVIWHGPWREKSVKDAIRTHNLSLTAVKKRGVNVEPAQLLKKLKSSGSFDSVLILFSKGPKIACALCRRVP